MPKHIYCLILALCILPIHHMTNASEPRFMRHPGISPDGKEICFVYQGDLWKVARRGGDAVRLTSHPAYDVRPFYSPDGRWIAYSSSRTVLHEVYVMPSGGGEPRRLTWFDSAYDIPSGWTPDSRAVLFSSFRDSSVDVYRVSLDAETPVQLGGEPFENEYAAKLSPDGKRAVFCRRGNAGAYQRWGYRGADNADIYLADMDAPWTNIRRLTTFEGHDLWPVFTARGDAILFCSSRDGASNIYRLKLTQEGLPDGKPIALTNFKNEAIHSMSLSADGKWLTFVRDYEIYVMKIPGGKPNKVNISIAVDAPRNRVSTHTKTNGVSEYSISPDGKKVAMVVSGDICITSSDDKTYTRQVTQTPWRECQLEWMRDSMRLIYASMRNGNRDLYVYDAGSGEERLLWEKTPTNEAHPALSPDGGLIACLVDDTTIVIADVTGAIKWEYHNPEQTGALSWRIPYAWSPDSRWLAFGKEEPRYSKSVAVYSVETGEVTTLSRTARHVYGMDWSNDGRLVFCWQLGDDVDIMALDNKPVAREFNLPDFEKLFEEKKEEKKEPDKKKPEASKEKKPKNIEFDLTDIRLRARRLTPRESNEWNPAITPDGKTAVFTSYASGQPQVYTCSADPNKRGGYRQRTSSGGDKGMIQISGDGKYAWYMNWGDDRVHRLTLSSGKDWAVPFRVETTVDEAALWKHAFIESWWMLDSYFYDSEMHGVDWKAVRTKYQALLPHIVMIEDYTILLNQMFGELNASHMGATYGASWRDGERPTGITGIELDQAELAQGEFVVKSVAPRSAASRPKADLRPGDRILKIGDAKLAPSSNWDELLSGKARRQLSMLISNASDGHASTRTAYLRPTSRRRWWELQYDNWVEDRRRRTEELSGGRLGYLHIRQMDGGALEKMKEDLRDQVPGRDGIVIDVRRNYGGNTATEMLGILQKKPWAWVVRRYGGKVSEDYHRSHSLQLPAICLINHQSVSNAEMFSSGFQQLGIGKVLGVPTEGSVIFTSSFGLLNGVGIRRPSVGIYTLAGENFEGKGREPDIYVDSDPSDYQEGRDRQLERAVEELLKQTK
jgi:tricorn protease